MDPLALRELARTVRDTRGLAGEGNDKLLEARRRIHQRATPIQREFLADPSRFIALRCGRRASKTYGAALLLADTCAASSYATCYYITERRERARELMWDSFDTGIKKLNEDLSLGFRFNNTLLEAKMRITRSVIKVRGAETRADVDKLRGEPGKLFVLDEVRNWTNPKLLDHLIFDVLLPSTADHKGRIVLCSNPGEVMAGEFYEATKPGASRGRPWDERDDEKWKKLEWLWSVHHWTAKDNIAQPQIWEELLEYKRKMGMSDENPWWRREILGEWVVDGSNAVFRFDPEKNYYDPDMDSPHGLPKGHEWRFLCGMDFGVVDEFALVVAATAPTHPVMFEIYAYREHHQTVSDIARVFRHAEAKFGAFDTVVGDTQGIGASFAQELAALPADMGGSISVECFPKQEKLTFIELFNADLVEGRIKVRRNSPLGDEMTHLQWADRTTKHKTVRGQKDHLADAFVGLWRASQHHVLAARSADPVPGTPEYNRMLADKGRDLIKKRREGEVMLDGESRLERRLDT